MEGFNEQVVKRQNGVKQLIIKITAVMLLLLVPAICGVLAAALNMPYLIMVGLFLFIGGIYGVWYTFTAQNVEYEYSIIGDVLHVSKVISLRRRKKMCAVPVKDIDLLEKGDKSVRSMNFSKVYSAVADVNATDKNYFAVFNSPAYGRCLLSFDPNDSILQGLKPYLKKEIVIKLFYNR